MKPTIFAILLALSTSLAAYAEDGDGKKGKRKRPPAVAIEACAAAVEGDACSFVHPRSEEEVTGICVVKREKSICKPDKASREARREFRRQKQEEKE
ncbi:MAG: hypothetical protein AAF385_06325 [Pseudomonadota bacterium]